jgi:hypothetical protein
MILCDSSWLPLVCCVCYTGLIKLLSISYVAGRHPASAQSSPLTAAFVTIKANGICDFLRLDQPFQLRLRKHFGPDVLFPERPHHRGVGKSRMDHAAADPVIHRPTRPRAVPKIPFLRATLIARHNSARTRHYNSNALCYNGIPLCKELIAHYDSEQQRLLIECSIGSVIAICVNLFNLRNFTPKNFEAVVRFRFALICGFVCVICGCNPLKK